MRRTDRLLHLGLLLMVVGGVLTWLLRFDGEIYLRPGREALGVIDARGVPHRFPHPLRLVQFNEVRHPATGAVCDYVSLVEVVGTADTLRISLNRPARLGGFRLYQSSYDGSGGSVLLVAHDPWGTAVVYLGFLLFAIGGFPLLLRHLRRRAVLWALIVFAVAVAAWAVALGLRHPAVMSSTPVLATPWLAVHVGLVVAGYAVLAATFPLSLVALVWPSKRLQLSQIARRLLAPGVYLLGMGIIIGAVWASLSWGRYWGWDPKETCALIALLVYALPLPLHLRMRPRTLSLYLCAALATIIITYYGIPGVPGLHTYR